MGKIDQFTDPNLSNEKRDKIMEELLKAKFEGTLRSRYEEKLEKEYSISRDIDNTPKASAKKNSKYIGFVILMALLAAGLLVGSKFMKQAEKTSIDKAHIYIAQNTMENQDISRSTLGDNNESQQKAIGFYNNKNYAAAISAYNEISNPNNEDIFFRSMSYLQEGNYEQSTLGFRNGYESIKVGERFYEECRLYLILSYTLNNQQAKAEAIFKSLDANSWSYKQASNVMQ